MRLCLHALPRDEGDLTILELGQVNGEWQMANGKCAPTPQRPFVIRHSPFAIAERLPHDDRSVDVVCGLNILGRSADPTAAAAEISRVARRRVVLLERNGLCVFHWQSGIRFAPWRLRSLFPREEFEWLGLRPVPLTGALDGWRARVAGVRWQCEGVMIVGQRRRAWRAAA